MIRRLPDNSLTIYADLLQKVEDSLFVSLTGGAFTSKNINGVRYWYYQTRTLNGQVQKYLGKESAALLAKIKETKEARREAETILNERRRLVAMLIASGATPEKGRPAKILEKMSDAGLFTSGGVLVGSFAFSSFGNMLGVRMDDALSRTEDMDFACEREIEIGLSRDMKEALTEAAPELKTPAQINPWVVPFEMKSPDGFKVEFLTTKKNARDKSPVPIERFGLHAQPLDFMDYLVADTRHAVILNGAGIPVVVPEPGRFALHKLAISQLRPAENRIKSKKDIAQAGKLIEVLAADNPGALLLALEAVLSRQDNMISFVRKGISLLPEEYGSQFQSICGRLLSE